jgi:hypothetical protein
MIERLRSSGTFSYKWKDLSREILIGRLKKQREGGDLLARVPVSSSGEATTRESMSAMLRRLSDKGEGTTRSVWSG